MDSRNFLPTTNKKARRERAIYSCNACHVQLQGYRARDNHNSYIHHGAKQTYTIITEESEAASIPLSLVSSTTMANLNKTSISNTSQSVDSTHLNMLPMKRAFEENASDVSSFPLTDIIADENGE